MLTLPLKQPGLIHALTRIRKKVYTPICRLHADILKSDEPILFENIDHSAFVPLKDGTAWGKKMDCAWIRVTGQIPAGAEDSVILLGLRGEGLVYSPQGEVLDSVSTVYILGDLPHSGGKYRPVKVSSASDERVELYIDAAYNGFLLYEYGRAVYHGALVAVRDDETFAYYHDFLTLTVLAEATDDKTLASELKKALRLSFSRFAVGDTIAARTNLTPLLSMPSQSELQYSAVGHGHLDMAWLWPLRETHRKAARTYVKALNSIEKYEKYIYGTSQPQQLFWMKHEQPDLYHRIQDAVADGRMELQGAFWVECDSNLSGGESLVRQAVCGRRFLLEEFGKEAEDIRLCWLPDAFGFSGNLPQILKKSGMDWFSTIKLAWNKVNRFPYRTFTWEGIDGSSVLVHMPPEGDYNSRGAADGLLKGVKEYPEKVLNTALLAFGPGDGGGGPGELNLEMTKREQNLRGLPRLKYASADSFFRHLETLDISHHHKGELYLETHQGTYTVQAKLKAYNRRIERKLHNVEALAVYRGSDCREKLRQPWQDLLLNQFHDIIPGSSIARVNREAAEMYCTAEGIIDTCYESLLMDTADSEVVPSVWNFTSFDRNEYVKQDGIWLQATLAPYSAAALEQVGSFPELSFSADTLSNGLMTLRFDSGGEIVSLTDANGAEHARKGLNRLVLHRDPYQFPFDAWDIDQNYHKRSRCLKARTAESYFDGPLAIRKHTYSISGVKIVQKVILESGSDVVKFETTVDWHVTHRMLRAEFYPTHCGETAQCEIQFGHISRPTTERDSVEKAQFEICAQKWLATQDEGAGFALLNDCKYGHRAKKGLISLNLLRSPTFPDKTADRGEHSFTYAICPFAKDGLSKVIREGYRLNNPLTDAKGATAESFVQSDNPAVIIETVKQAESGNGIVLRLYESLGAPAQTALTTTLPYAHAFETDLLESHPVPVDLARLNFTPFEIKTILLEGETL